LVPNFDSTVPHEVLGCDVYYSTQEDIDRAYRDLSRKYHPSRGSTSSPSSSGQENSVIFQKISTAYTRIKTIAAAHDAGDDNDNDNDNENISTVQIQHSATTPESLYEQMFGEYRELYYNDGGMIGLPYSSDLHERLQSTRKYRDVFSVQLCGVPSSSTTTRRLRVGFFQTWFIKKDTSITFWLCELLMTWTVIGFCKDLFFK
jgi:curved DNA-binding protein CbpA